MKKVLTLAVALAVVSSGYLCEVNGAAEPITKKAPSISEFNIYMCQKELNERQKILLKSDVIQLAEILALRETIISAIERGTLTPQEVSIAIRQLYSAAGLKQMNAALATFEQLREERPEFGVDYDKLVPKRVGLSALLGNGSK